MHSKSNNDLISILAEYASNTYVQIGLLAVLLLLYLLTRSQIFGLLSVLVLIGFVIYEFYAGVKENGWKNELKEIIITILAVLIFWEALIIVLGTDTPISGIATCSMKPNMNRGDLIILQNVNPKAPIVELSESELNNITAQFTYKNLTSNGSLYNLCMFNKNTHLCKDFILHPTKYYEYHGPIRFNYGACNLSYNNLVYRTPCVVSISVKDKIIPMKISRDIIAYRPKKTDIFYRIGDISHRLQLIIKSKSDNKTYYLTKGDNNQVFDIQMYDYNLHQGNSLIDKKSQYKGKVIFKIPYVGYYKLFLSGMFGAVPQCSTVLYTPNFED